MKRNQRLSVALHVLVHLVERGGAAVSSEELAGCVRTNPVVIRRTLAGLREAGLVTSTAGHGGGWRLARDPGRIAVREVSEALGAPLLYAVDLSLEAGCAVQAAVSEALDDVLREAEARLLVRLGGISLADLAARVHGNRGGAR